MKTAREPVRREPATPTRKPFRISLVDDDEAASDAVALLLRINGYAVTTHHSANAFLKDPDIDSYDCLLLDMHMPTMSGLELLELLRSRCSVLPAIIMTGLPQKVLTARLAKAGPAAMLEKPVSEEDLLRCVGDACRRQS